MASGNDPTTNIHTFAQWAIEPAQRAFRITAASDLRRALDDAKDEPHLEEEEIEYCEGWLYLARVEIGDVSEDELDKQLVEKVTNHLERGAVLMNG